MKLVVNEAFNDLLRCNRIFTNSDGRPRWRAGEIITVSNDVVIEPYVHLMAGKTFPRRMGAFTYSHSSIDPCFTIGRYCSIAHGLLPMGSQHPIEWATTSPFSYFSGTLVAFDAYFGDRKLQRPSFLPFDGGAHHITIGNDVWIGGSVLIKRGVTIGHGAVIAARAVVTHDVPPYAIVAGVPARILRYRFAEAVIARLIASQWWDYGPDVVSQLEVRDPEGLPDRLQEALGKGAKPLDLTAVEAQDMIRAVETKSA